MDHTRKHKPDFTKNAKALRKNMTAEERHMWYDFLRDYPVRILRQKVIDSFIADFYCHAARLVIELDGSQHYEPAGKLKDSVRTTQIEKRGLLVIRIPNNAVRQNFRGVCEYLDAVIKERIDVSPSQPPADSPL